MERCIFLNKCETRKDLLELESEIRKPIETNIQAKLDAVCLSSCQICDYRNQLMNNMEV